MLTLYFAPLKRCFIGRVLAVLSATAMLTAVLAVAPVSTPLSPEPVAAHAQQVCSSGVWEWTYPSGRNGPPVMTWNPNRRECVDIPHQHIQPPVNPSWLTWGACGAVGFVNPPLGLACGAGSIAGSS